MVLSKHQQTRETTRLPAPCRTLSPSGTLPAQETLTTTDQGPARCPGQGQPAAQASLLSRLRVVAATSPPNARVPRPQNATSNPLVTLADDVRRQC
jgi:hypothetical protein